MGTTYRITQIEQHLSHACNFTCKSCSHFSDSGHTGRITTEQFISEVSPWANRLEPRYVLLLGGEPLMNPDVCRILPLARMLWSKPIVIILVTNGWLLYRYPQLPSILQQQGIRLDISVHHNGQEYIERLEDIKQLVESNYEGVDVRYRESFRDWSYIYKGSGADIHPYNDSNPARSWRSCVSKWCMQIHEGKLWKCPPLAYLPMQVKKFNIDPKGEWAPYLAYKALEPSCSDSQLSEFIHRQCESYCSMCPTNPQHFEKPSPLIRRTLPIVSDS